MKPVLAFTLFCAISLAAFAEDKKPDPKETLAKHHEGAAKVAEGQDELSGDAQQLRIEQTIPKVIELLKQCEGIMDDATDYLSDSDTGGRTIAAQTEVIEKIHEAAKQRQQQGGCQSGAGGALMDMLEKSMQRDEGKDPGKSGQDGKPGSTPGQGQTGDSKAANNPVSGDGDAKNGECRVPKAAGSAGSPPPAEFQKAFDAYNRGIEHKTK